ncbi:MAG: hypothetical protein LQ340_001970 [Diploschistes diacapsis]|nr:MAG: hypothetical protein LQ340_001970 [Diploschistes diacapsis]
MASDKGSRTVFIGNIPYGLTEEAITQICGAVGQVINFRLVYDSDTGRPKGFGFAEFSDADAAASAVRNLDKYQIQGRELRVDYSHVGSKDKDSNQNQQQNNQQTVPMDLSSYANFPQQGVPLNGLGLPQPGQGQGQPPTNPLLGPLPHGAELPAGLTCPDAISKTLSTLPTPQLLDILSQMKSLVTDSPTRAAELLKQAPQLSYAIFQALLLMGLVDSSLIAQVVESSASTPGQGMQIPPQNMASRPFTQLQQQPGPAQYGTPPVGIQRPPPQQQQQQQPQPIPQLPPGQEDLIRQLLAMPQSEIDKLNPAERGQIMALRGQFGGAVI